MLTCPESCISSSISSSCISFAYISFYISSCISSCVSSFIFSCISSSISSCISSCIYLLLGKVNVLRISSACSAGAARLSIGETHFAVLTCFDYLGYSFQALYVDVSLPALKSHVSTILDIVFRHYMLTCKLSGVRTLAEIMTYLQFAKMYNIVSQMKN